MPKKSKEGVSISISRIPSFGEQLGFLGSYGRRVNEDYIIPEPKDPFVKSEGLHPCSVVPSVDEGKILTVVYRKPVTTINPVPDDELFRESARAFDQQVVKRHIVPRKGRIYYGNNRWFADEGSPEGMYATLIFPKELIDKVVLLVDMEQ